MKKSTRILQMWQHFKLLEDNFKNHFQVTSKTILNSSETHCGRWTQWTLGSVCRSGMSTAHEAAALDSGPAGGPHGLDKSLPCSAYGIPPICTCFTEEPSKETAQPLGSLSHCSITSITYPAQKYFLVFRRNLCVLVFAHCLPSWHWALLVRAWLHPQSDSLKNKCKALAPCPQVQAVVGLLNL